MAFTVSQMSAVTQMCSRDAVHRGIGVHASVLRAPSDTASQSFLPTLPAYTVRVVTVPVGDVGRTGIQRYM